MGAALILYGSRARGEARPGSDVDLILAEEGISISSPTHGPGISLHLYSKGWLENEARNGSLFVYHVAFEGIPLRDSEQFLPNLRNSFSKKLSYRDDQSEAALVLRMLLEKDWDENFDARRRYFWALRTIVICETAELGTPKFSADALEAASSVRGLAEHIDNRETASFLECQNIGESVIKSLGIHLPDLHREQLREYLLGLGGIARDSVRVVEEHEAIETTGIYTYL